MAGRSAEVTPALLREWGLPASTGSKYDRGRVLVIGGASRTPGAAQLAGLAALRVGAGHLTLAVAEPVAIPLAVATPEAGVAGLPANSRGSVLGGDLSEIEQDVSRADVVVAGPGLDDADQTAELLRGLVPMLDEHARLVLDVFALGPLPDLGDVTAPLAGRLLLTPNGAEGHRLLGRQLDDAEADVLELARRFSAVVTCQGIVAEPRGERWRVGAGHSGLATSGSGDVLAGTLGGLLARSVDAAEAACWATYLHAAAGDRLAARVGRLGFLAREILDELPAVLVELSS